MLKDEAMANRADSASNVLQVLKADIMKECAAIKSAMTRMTLELDSQFKCQERMVKEQLAAYHENLSLALDRDCDGKGLDHNDASCMQTRSRSKATPVKPEPPGPHLVARKSDRKTFHAEDHTTCVRSPPVPCERTLPEQANSKYPRESIVTDASDMTRISTDKDTKKERIANIYGEHAERTSWYGVGDLARLAGAAGIKGKTFFVRSKKQKRFYCPRLDALVNSCTFNTVVMVVIGLSIIHVGALEMETSARYQEQGDRLEYAPNKHLLLLDWVFAVFFSIESVMRILVEQHDFLLGRMKHWNVLDLFLAGTYWSEAMLALLGADVSHDYPVLIFFRPLRTLRAVRSFKESRRLLVSIMHAIRPFFWVFGFLAISIFMFAVPIQQAVSKLTSEAPADDEVVKAVQKYFIRLGKTYVSLFMAITSGNDWGEMMDALSSIHWLYAYFFLCYISLMVFCVSNIITGIFVEGAASLASKDRDLATQAEAERTAERIHILKGLFEEIDEDSTGCISKAAFEKAVTRDEVHALFVNIGIDNPEDIFELVDADGNKDLEIDEFVMGCMRLGGALGKVDIELLVRENRNLCQRVRKFFRLAKHNMHRLDAVAEQIADMAKHADSPRIAC